MNYKRYLFSLLLLFVFNISKSEALSQNSDTVQSTKVEKPPTDSTSSTDTNKTLAEIKKRLTALEKNTEKQSLGTFTMETDEITIYKNKKPTLTQLKIDSIILIIEEGFINDIQVI